MIKAAKQPVGNWLVWRLIRGALAKHFSAVHVRQRGTIDARLPTIFQVTHSSWWDGYLCMVLDRLLLQRDPYLMMEEKNLRRYRFFAWAGVFGVDREDGRAALAALDYSADLLRDHPNRSLYLFPQGSIFPSDRRPLRLYSGVARLAARVGAVQIAPVAIRYEFLQEQRPEVFASVGPPRLVLAAQAGHHRALLADLTADLTSELDRLHTDLISEAYETFATVLQGRGGIDRAFDRLLLRGRRQSRRHRLTSDA